MKDKKLKAEECTRLADTKDEQPVYVCIPLQPFSLFVFSFFSPSLQHLSSFFFFGYGAVYTLFQGIGV